ncbi:hypothetical protein I551_8789 [Mycobacterium ulcerans str. Harvey]|uniref:Uncharacterized protein n=1 Tax=Mycobacterium ulcerans str. Harvey TaxID=1299332 RepID=A0ABN0RA23_MYCUL|nr:hypothetical protein I551_8789 [Mycobacterium ulcerans str. Harvey]
MADSESTAPEVTELARVCTARYQVVFDTAPGRPNGVVAGELTLAQFRFWLPCSIGVPSG